MTDWNKLNRIDNAWHGAINRFHEPLTHVRRPFMYEAKKAWREVPRMVLLFEAEREGKLPQTHRQCSLSPTEPVPDNHLTCCLGVECRKCPELAAIDSADLSPEEKDEAKAWTCMAHIVTGDGDVMNEGYILTTDDRMFWDRTYANLSAALTESPSEGHSEKA